MKRRQAPASTQAYPAAERPQTPVGSPSDDANPSDYPASASGNRAVGEEVQLGVMAENETFGELSFLDGQVSGCTSSEY